MVPGKVLIIQNDATENLGLYEMYLQERTDVDVVHAYSMNAKDTFPDAEMYIAFIVGPTPISANDIAKHQFLSKEWQYLARIVRSRKPVLGVCCGGQLLSRLLGGEIVRSSMREVGGYTVTLTDTGIADPLFSGFPREVPVFQWHTDMFKIPLGGNLLALGDPCPIQAYAWNKVRGVIFHLEIDHHDAARWASAYPAELVAIGKTQEQVIEECRSREPKMRCLAKRLIENFLTI